MNNKKSRFTLLSILVLAILCLAALAGCKDNPSDSPNTGSGDAEIFIEKSQQPRLLYVEGQELDLSKGSITVTNGSEKTQVPFTDPGVSITGYDKNSIGDQILTVSYDGKTTTLKVAVVARMTVEEARTRYFIGEIFNKEKGKVKIADDNAKTSYVNMSDASITVKSFDSSKAGTATATIQYTKGSVSYECSFQIEILEPDKIEFYPPKQIAYLSHVKELNLKGGSLFIQAKGDSSVKETIALTQNMVSGYNPDAVTDKNKDDPVTQQITVSYAGENWTFDVEVTYSPIYVIQAYADKLEGINLEVADVTQIVISDDAGMAAKEAMERYFSLSVSDRKLLDYDLMVSFARVAAYYVNTKVYVKAAEEFSDAIIYTPNGQIIYVGKSYEAVENAIDIIGSSTSEYNKSASLLTSIKDAFGKEEFNAQYKISALTSVHTTELAQKLIERLEHILNVFDALENIEADWRDNLDTEEFKESHRADIYKAKNLIVNSEFQGPQFTGLYNVIRTWRSDFFDIIYCYYYYVENDVDKLVNELWGKVPAPGLLEDFYNAFNSAYTQSSVLKENINSATRYDLYQFHYFRIKAIKLADEIKASSNKLYTTLYNAIGLDTYIETYLNAPNAGWLGYYDFAGAAYGNKNIEDLLNKYWEVLDILYSEGTVSNNTANNQKIDAVFESLSNLTPAELHWFLSSISFRYHNTRGAVLILKYSENANFLTQLLFGYFFSNDIHFAINKDEQQPAQIAFENLLLAMESYSLSYYNEKAIENFHAYMQNVYTVYNQLSGIGKARFDKLLGSAYSTYKAIDANYKTQNLDPDHMTDKFEELYTTLQNFDAIFAISQSEDPRQQWTYPMMIALYSKATMLYNEIYEAAKTSTPVKNALLAKLYAVLVTEDTVSGDQVTLHETLDKYYYDVRGIALDIMLANGNVWYAAQYQNVQNLLVKILPLMTAEFKGEVYTGEDVVELIGALRALTPNEKFCFYTIQANQIFYAGLERYFNTLISDAARDSKMLTYLFTAEIYYTLYELNTNDAQSVNTFKANMESAIGAYSSLTDDDKELLDDLYYNGLLEKYNAILAEEETTDEKTN